MLNYDTFAGLVSPFNKQVHVLVSPLTVTGASACSVGPLTVTKADEHSGSCPFF